MLALRVLFFIIFVLFFGERPVLFGREPNPVIRSWDKRGHVQTATRAQWVGTIDAAHFHDLHTLCISSISETYMKTETFVGMVCY